MGTSEDVHTSDDQALLKHMGTDPEKWATEFCKLYPMVDWEDARTWFSLALNAGQEQVPDG